MDVERYPDNVFLYDVGFLEMRRPRLEVVRVPNEHVTLAAGRAVQLDDDRAIDLRAALELAGQFEPGARKPLTLQLAARFPIEHRLVPKVRNRHLLVLFEREVRDEGPVRHDDDFTLLELRDQRHKVGVVGERDHFVDKTEGAIEALGIATRDG